MKELGKSSLKTWLRYWAKYKGKILEGKELQAYKQIWRLIELHFDDDWQDVKKELGKFMQKQKPKVSKNDIIELSENIWDAIIYQKNGIPSICILVKDFLSKAGVEIEE